MDHTTHNWRQTGRIYLWHYVDNPKNYRGWHLAADADGCKSLRQLLASFQTALYSTKQRIDLDQTDDRLAPVENYAGRYRSYSRWEIQHSKSKHAADHWQLTADGNLVQLELGLDRVAELANALTQLSRGNDDFLIGDDGQELWFWRAG